ncbi:MAG: hypothetical protein ACJ74D_06830 [Gaiellaceae bacterium]
MLRRRRSDPLADLSSHDPSRRSAAVGELQETLVHQGTVSSQAAAAVPAVADAALGAAVGRDDRLWLILLLAWIAGGTGKRSDVEAARAALHERLPKLLARFDDEQDPSLQIALATLAAQFPEDAEHSRPRVERLIAAQADDPRRVVLEVACAALGGDVDDADILRRLPDDYYDGEERAELRERLAHDDRSDVFRDVLDNISGAAIRLEGSDPGRSDPSHSN